MNRIRVGIFSRRTTPAEGGADTLLQMIAVAMRTVTLGPEVELVEVPWTAWSQRRNPLRYAAVRLLRTLGHEIPEVDLRSLCRRLRLDLAYFTTPAFVRIDIPYVFTLWDLGHRMIPDFPEVRTGRVPWSQREALCRTMLPQASFVVVGNNAGALEAQRGFGLDPEKVVAVPFPNPDFSGVSDQIPAWLSDRPFFLYPAQLWPHKNHVTLLKALAVLSASGRPVPELVVVGSDQGNLDHLRTTAAALGIGSSVRFAGFVPRGELKVLYRRSIGLVFPSMLGPNNLPPQEAAVLGCPMILSDLAGHREQLGDGALYAPALEAEAWAEAMQRLAADEGLRARLTAQARVAVAGNTTEAYAARIGQTLVRLAACRMLWAR